MDRGKPLPNVGRTVRSVTLVLRSALIVDSTRYVTTPHAPSRQVPRGCRNGCRLRLCDAASGGGGFPIALLEKRTKNSLPLSSSI